MAITDTQKVDYLFKKIGYSIAKTANSTVKSPSNETISSPLVIRGDTIWQQGGTIPATQPGSTTGYVTVYNDSSSNTVQCTADSTAPSNQTWKTNLTNWIDPSFGATYQVKIFLDTTGAVAPQSTGTQLFPDGSGNNDEWFFDYSAGVLNFIGTNLPSNSFTGKSIFVVGARYTGPVGVTTYGSLAIGNLTINGNNISSSSGNVTIAADLFVTGNTTLAGYSDITILDSIINLHTQSNLAPWTVNDGKDIGINMHYYDGTDSHAGLVRANDSGYLEWYARGIEGYGNVFQGNAYGTIKTGELWLSNSTSSVSTTSGALRVDGGAGIQGNLFVGNTAHSTNVHVLGTTNSTQIGTGALVVEGGMSVRANVFAGNITSVFYGNVNTNYITPYTNTVVSFSGQSAIGLPVGVTSNRPTGAPGYLRYNLDSNSIEYYNGSAWTPVTNTVTDQQITPDGTSDTYTLDQEATTVGIVVSINGIVQRPNTEYTVHDSNQITFTEIPLDTDIIDIRFLGATVNMSLTLSDDLQVSGNITLSGILSAPPTTKTSTSPGTAGQVCWDANYIYICTAANTWKRVTLTGGVF